MLFGPPFHSPTFSFRPQWNAQELACDLSNDATFNDV